MAKRSVVFWNVHRMFGSSGSPIEYALSGDNDAEMKDTGDSIQKKTHIIAAVLDCIAEIAGPPLLVGFAEIEDAALSSDIAGKVRSASLSEVDEAAQDETGFALDGLDLSLLFDTEYFKGVNKLRSHVINRTFITRDILECDLQLKSGGTLSVLLNHWPSRMVGEAAGQRITAAHYTRSLIASKTRFSLGEMWDPENRSIHVPQTEDLKKRALTPVVVMGDFNDEMFDASIELLGSTNDKEAILNDLKVKGQSKKKRFRSYTSSTPQMYNPFWTLAGRGGSYYRSPRWRCYDQILLSRGFLEQDCPLRFVSESESVFSKEHVTLADGSIVQLTNRNGKPIAYEPENHRGCSDHFAVFVSIEVN